MATSINFKGIDQLTQKSTIAGTEKFPVSDTQYVTANQIASLGGGGGGGGGDTSDCVHKTGDETVGGDKTFTDDIVVCDASNIKYGASSGSGFTRGYASVVCDDRDYLEFTGITEAPAAFIVTLDLSGDSSDTGIIAVIGDSTGTHAVYSADSTHQHNYTASCETFIENGFGILAGTTGFISGATYKIVYYAGSGTLTFRTATVSPGSGATSVTFTDANLTAVPAFYATMLESQVNNESYRRVAYYTNEGGGSTAAPMGVSFYSSQIHNTTSNFTVSYNNGLVINSGGTNAGGYFHNPGTYTLYYLMASDIGGGGGSYQSLDAELSAMSAEISAKQDALVSGTNIKTINSTSLLGSGNINIASLPTVTTTNNGQILEVSNGAWAAGRTITISSSEPTAYQGNNGDIWIVI